MNFQFDRLPNFEEFEGKPVARIQELAEEYGEKKRQWYQQKVAFNDARNSHPEAGAEDQKARAAALRSGGKDPGRVNEERVRKEMEEIVDRSSLLEVVIRDVGAELAAEIQRQKGTLLEQARAQRDQAGEKYREAALALRAAHDRFQHAVGLVSWVYQPGPSFTPGQAANQVLSLPTELDPRDPEAEPNEVAAIGNALSKGA